MIVLVLVLVLMLPGAAHAESKRQATPAFWQRDPTAHFPNEGRNHCAPTSISDGLMYLAAARGASSLVAGRDHAAQIRLVSLLGDDMHTDPKEGTSPDKILAGLKNYVASRGYKFKRLEVATWRTISGSNRVNLVGARPDVEWVRRAADDPDTVVLLNAGWYHREGPAYRRKDGHWVIALGSRGARGFDIHNPALEPGSQAAHTAVTLSPMPPFTRVYDGGSRTMSGYYRIDGPGLPFKGTIAAAVLDSVNVFSVAR